MIECCICGQPVADDEHDPAYLDTHTIHSAECDNGENQRVCTCSGVAHADCCPDCNPTLHARLREAADAIDAKGTE